MTLEQFTGGLEDEESSSAELKLAAAWQARAVTIGPNTSSRAKAHDYSGRHL
jgi:hypothetical protein